MAQARPGAYSPRAFRKDRHTRVCLLEAGGPARHPFIQVPALVGAAIMHRGLTWGLSTEPQAALNNRRIPLPRGRVVGGSGSINGMAYHRGHPKDYDDWAAAGNAGWSWQEVLPYFRLSENNADRRDVGVHGVDGPIHVTFIPKPNRSESGVSRRLCGGRRLSNLR